MTMAGGVMQMAQLTALDIAASEKIAFAPGGKHLMLFELKPDLQPGGSIRLAFSFQSGKQLELNAKLVAAGDMHMSEGHDGH
jgi:periplasmic copper chaperone A